MEWGCEDADALENKIMSRFSWCLGQGTLPFKASDFICEGCG